MIQNVTDIVIATAAVIGLVPLGIRSMRDVIKSRQKKKSNEWAGTIALSVLLSLVAPGVLEAVGRHVKAAGDALPDWVKAAIPPPVPPPSPNGSEPQGTTQQAPSERDS